MVLVVDDLQWADQATVTLWERLSRSARHLPLLLIGMMRPVPQREDLLALRHTADLAARFQLGALREESVIELVGTLACEKPDHELQYLADGAAGNPLYLTELVEALARSSSLSVSDVGTAELTSGHAPESLSAAIADRLGFCAPCGARSAARGRAARGWTSPFRTWPPAGAGGVADLVSALEEARAAGRAGRSQVTDSGSGIR